MKEWWKAQVCQRLHGAEKENQFRGLGLLPNRLYIFGFVGMISAFRSSAISLFFRESNSAFSPRKLYVENHIRVRWRDQYGTSGQIFCYRTGTFVPEMCPTTVLSSCKAT